MYGILCNSQKTYLLQQLGITSDENLSSPSLVVQIPKSPSQLPRLIRFAVMQGLPVFCRDTDDDGRVLYGCRSNRRKRPVPMVIV